MFHLFTALVLLLNDNFTTLWSTATLWASKVSQLAGRPRCGGLATPGQHSVPLPPILPHKFIVRALTLVQEGRADHKTMWEGLASEILAEASKMAAYRSLLDFLKVTALCRSPFAGQGVDRPAETQLPFLATFIDDTIRHQASQIKTAHLPGLVPVTRATAQLAFLQQSQLVFMQTQVAARTKVRTLTKYNANIASAIWAIPQVSLDAPLTSYW
jgi:hypothetical protein